MVFAKMRDLFKIAISRAMILLFFVFLAQPKVVPAQDKTLTWYADVAVPPADKPVNLIHLEARVSFVPEKNQVMATATFTLTPLRTVVDSIMFFTPDFQIHSVLLDNAPIPYYQSGNNLIIGEKHVPVPARGSTRSAGSCSPFFTKGDTCSLQIVYTATPLKGPIYFIGWRPEEKGKRQAIWAHRPMGWLPYADARITTDLFVTFDKRFTVFSNGERTEVRENTDSTLTWHYAIKNNHPFFSTALVIGDYQYKTSVTSRGIPLEYWYYTGMEERVPTTYKYTEEMFSFFEKELGVNYPYPVYREAPVIDYMYGAMETTTSTVFGDYMLISPRSWWQRNYVNVNAHELAHQWFGNYVAHLTGRDVWLTESFGTYYAKLFERHIYGEAYYQKLRNDEFLQAFDAAKKNDYPIISLRSGVQRIYQKGSLVLDMLRDVMGEEDFRDAVKDYLKKYGWGYAETNDFIRCVYDATGSPYNWFFDQWILRGGEPEYKVSWEVTDDTLRHRSTRIHVWQMQQISSLNGLFRMPIGFEVHYTDGSYDSTRIWIEDQYTEVRLPNKSGKRISYILFDPGRKILKKVDFQRSYSELEAQLTGARQMIDRYDALLALRDTPVDQKSVLLTRSFRKERFHLIRSEILGQLAADTSPEIMELFREALKDPDAEVRKAALTQLKRLPDLLRGTVEGMLNDSSFLNIELALNGLCTSFPESAPYYLQQTADMEGWRGKNIRMKWLEMAMLYHPDTTLRKVCLTELIGYSGPVFEFETRMNALNLLKKIRYADTTTLANARSAADHWNNKLSAVGKEYLKIMEEN